MKKLKTYPVRDTSKGLELDLNPKAASLLAIVSVLKEHKKQHENEDQGDRYSILFHSPKHQFTNVSIHRLFSSGAYLYGHSGVKLVSKLSSD